MADRRAHAVAARVAAADDDHVLSLAVMIGRLPFEMRIAGHAAVLLRQKIHRQVDAVEIGAGHAQAAAALPAPMHKHDGVEAFLQLRAARDRRPR